MGMKPLIQTVPAQGFQATSFDPEAFTQAIRTQGVLCIHARAMRCPVGMVELHSNHRPDHDHVGCSNGFVYTEAGKLMILFSGNHEDFTKHAAGSFASAQVQATAETFYRADDCDGDNYSDDAVWIAPFDRLYLSNRSIVVPHWQVFVATGESERLEYPVEQIQDVMDSEGRTYEDVETGKHGEVIWGDTHPVPGTICSIRYLYRPFYYVDAMPHQIRIAQVEDRATGKRLIVKMPQAMSLVREYVRRDTDADAIPSERTVNPPGDPEFA